MRFLSLGHPVEIDGPDEALKAAARRWPERDVLFDVPALTFRVDVTGSGPPGPMEYRREAGRFQMECGAGQGIFEAVARTGCIRASTEALELMLESVVLTALDWTFFTGVHAACVTREGRSVLLAGDSHAGKSTLAYVCARAGWTYVSDNALHWAPEPWNVLVSGSPVLRLREGARAMLGVGQEELAPVEHGLRTSRTAQPGAWVFLRRRPGPAVLRECDRADAIRYLGSYDPRFDRDVERYEALLRCGVWTLEYEDAWGAAERLEALA